MFKYLVLLALGLAYSADVSAQQDYPRDITLDWVNPSQYVDGSTIELGDLDSIRVECTRNGDVAPVFVSTVPDTGEGSPQVETFVGVIPQPGTYTCVAFAIVVDGTESDPSNTASRKYIGKPLPPQTFK
mgnify:CR=1 FL=1